MPRTGLGVDVDLAFRHDKGGLTVDLPDRLPGNGPAALRIEGLRNVGWDSK